jgi:hypothetical protein
MSCDVDRKGDFAVGHTFIEYKKDEQFGVVPFNFTNIFAALTFY